MSTNEDPMVQNRSMLKDFLASIVTMTGDLSNITAPPFILDTKSVVEIPTFWAENPSIFVSPAQSDDPIERALRILRAFLAGMRSQCYMGHDPAVGVKKPLNAFLGELFVGKWEDDYGTTHVISEQVCHHPPITACRVWNDKFGVVSEGYNRQKITFSGSVNVQCLGHILRTVTKYDEHYLVPIPDFKIKGVLGTPYPELSDTYHIPSTNGYTSAVHFSGKGWFSSSKKHQFTAHLFKEDEGEDKPLYTISGHWDSEYTIHDNRKGKDIEVFNVEEHALKGAPELIVDPIDEQDPWESRNAWKDVVTAIKNNDMKGVSEAKNHLEQGQRDMREDEGKRGEEWRPLFFKTSKNHKIIQQLNDRVPNEDFRQSKIETEGVWQFDLEAWNATKKPYHGSLCPDNTTVDKAGTTDKGSKLGHGDKPNSQPSREVDHKVGAVEDGRPAEINATLMDVGREPAAKEIQGITKDQPAAQAAQSNITQEQLNSGVEGMSIDEKEQVENMLRDQYSSASKERRTSRAKRHSAVGT